MIEKQGLRTLSAQGDPYSTAKEDQPRSRSSKLSSFHYLLYIVLLLPPLRTALTRFHSTCHILVRLQIIQTDHLVATRHGTLLLREFVGAQHLSNGFCREGVLTDCPENRTA